MFSLGHYTIDVLSTCRKERLYLVQETYDSFQSDMLVPLTKYPGITTDVVLDPIWIDYHFLNNQKFSFFSNDLNVPPPYAQHDSNFHIICSHIVCTVYLHITSLFLPKRYQMQSHHSHRCFKLLRVQYMNKLHASIESNTSIHASLWIENHYYW